MPGLDPERGGRRQGWASGWAMAFLPEPPFPLLQVQGRQAGGLQLPSQPCLAPLPS